MTINIKTKTIEQNENSQILIFDISGFINEKAVTHFEEQTLGKINEKCKLVVLDIKSVDHIISSGVVIILKMDDFLENHGSKLYIINANYKIANFLEKINKRYLLSNYKTPKEVVKEYQEQYKNKHQVSDKLKKKKTTSKSKENKGNITEKLRTTLIKIIKHENIKKIDENKQEAKASILIVDDDNDMVNLLSFILKKAGYNITSVLDGADALYTMGQKKFDLLLVDIELPVMTGFGLLEFSHRKNIETPIIIITARDSEANEIKALELGAADYIRKPYKKKVILARIKRILKQ